MKCETCGGSGHVDKPVDCCGEREWPFRCAACNGSGQQPEAPPPELRRCLYSDSGPGEIPIRCGNMTTLRNGRAPCCEKHGGQQPEAPAPAAPAELAAVLDAARAWYLKRLRLREIWAAPRRSGKRTAYTDLTVAETALEAALAAMEATDGR